MFFFFFWRRGNQAKEVSFAFISAWDVGFIISLGILAVSCVFICYVEGDSLLLTRMLLCWSILTVYTNMNLFAAKPILFGAAQKYDKTVNSHQECVASVASNQERNHVSVFLLMWSFLFLVILTSVWFTIITIVQLASYTELFTNVKKKKKYQSLSLGNLYSLSCTLFYLHRISMRFDDSGSLFKSES